MTHPPAEPNEDGVRYQVAAGVATVTLARPAAMNSLDLATKDALLAALRAAAGDPAVRAVVLTGEGRAFCVGQDLREHAGNLDRLDPAEVWATVPRHYAPLAATLAGMPKPVVAAVNGVAAGAGAALAFACDFRVVAESAGFNLAFAGIGLSVDTGTSWTLPRLVGHARALELLLLPRTVPAAEALALGLATQVVPADRVAAESADLAARLAAGPTLAYAAIKEALLYAATAPLAAALEREGELMARTGRSVDHRAAVAAFLDRRPPVFEGR